MKLIHTKSLEELKIKYLERSVESAKKKPQTWTPLRWHKYKDRLLKKRGVISDLKIISIVNRAYPLTACVLPDKKYCVTSVQDYRKFLALDDADKAEYIDGFYDCDDFAYRLMGNLNHPLYGSFAHGLAMSISHAFNCFVDWKNKLYIIEPQNDEIMEAPVEEDMYRIHLVVM